VSTFGRQNRTNTRVAPAQIEVFVRGHFADRLSCRRFLGGALSRCAAEREACLSTRTLRVFQCSAALNHMGGRKGSIQEWNMARYSSVIQAQIDEPLQVELTGHQMAYQSPLDRVTRRKGP